MGAEIPEGTPVGYTVPIIQVPDVPNPVPVQLEAKLHEE
jgi:hypothetical protein